MEILFIIIVVAVVLAVSVWLYIARQGDAEFEFLTEQRTNFKVEEITKDKVVLTTNIPFVNKGTQDGTIMDCYTRHLLPYEQFDEVTAQSRLELESKPRKDGYFEAMIVPKTTGNAINLTLIFTAVDGDIQKAMKNMVDMSVDIVFQVVARSEWYISKQRLAVPAVELVTAMSSGQIEA